MTNKEKYEKWNHLAGEQVEVTVDLRDTPGLTRREGTFKFYPPDVVYPEGVTFYREDHRAIYSLHQIHSIEPVRKDIMKEPSVEEMKEIAKKNIGRKVRITCAHTGDLYEGDLSFCDDDYIWIKTPKGFMRGWQDVANLELLDPHPFLGQKVCLISAWTDDIFEGVLEGENSGHWIVDGTHYRKANIKQINLVRPWVESKYDRWKHFKGEVVEVDSERPYPYGSKCDGVLSHIDDKFYVITDEHGNGKWHTLRFAKDMKMIIESNPKPEDPLEAEIKEYFQEIRTAPGILKEALSTMKVRGEQRDSPEGERSMEDTVALFNRWSGKELTAFEGWMFMVFLKMVRAKRGEPDPDHFVDGGAYMALAGEEALR